MVRFLRLLSIRTKLNLVAFIAGGLALILSTAGFIVNDFHLIRTSKARQLSVLARILGKNTAGALASGNSADARETLDSLGLTPRVERACLYDAEGRIFATYPVDCPRDQFPPAPKENTREFIDGFSLALSEEIVRDGKKLGAVYLRGTMTDLWTQLSHYIVIVGLVVPISLFAGVFLSQRVQRLVSDPIIELAQTAQEISTKGDHSIRVHKHSNDELGALFDEFNAMLEHIQDGDRQLQAAHDQLEQRVEQRTRELSETNAELSKEIAERRRTERQLADVHRQLVETGRRAGMAEIATGVLHNVGNVLNSVNVSATLVADRLRCSKIVDLTRALDLFHEHADDLGRFLTEDSQGRQLPAFLQLVATHLDREHTAMLKELQSLTRHVDHIKTIVATQQSYAGVAGVVEAVSLAELLDDALNLSTASLEKNNIEVVRQYEDLPEVAVEQQKVLQILVNIVTNAKDALVEGGEGCRRLIASIRLQGGIDEPKVLIEVRDNGVGISPEDITRIFSHGFTTKQHGHGFGLHSSANAAKELGGKLTASSDGVGHGALFTLELPFHPVEVLA